MKLYIQMSGGQPHEHPIVEWNFKQAFPDIDVNNLPPEYCPFVRVEAPALGVYQHNQAVSYGLVEGLAGTYTDIWTCEDMTAEEKLAKQNAVKIAFSTEHPTWASWDFDEDTCTMVPPVPFLGDPYTLWDEETLLWVIPPEAEEEV
jgi:hypothetical protein|tara:strand:+ start:332 stop:769 length:438 start_codon:yes stop_codon:yes gene_type:complete